MPATEEDFGVLVERCVLVERYVRKTSQMQIRKKSKKLVERILIEEILVFSNTKSKSSDDPFWAASFFLLIKITCGASKDRSKDLSKRVILFGRSLFP